MKEYPDVVSEGDTQKKEYLFEEGICEVVSRVRELFNKQERVTIAVIGSGTDVGKTRVSGQIAQRLHRLGWECCLIPDIGAIHTLYKDQILRHQVILLDAEYFPYFGLEDQDEKLRKKLRPLEISGIDRIDIRVFVYRFDKPFPSIEDPHRFNGIVICNEGAVDDPSKMRSTHRVKK